MQKTISWLTGLVTGGLIVVALTIYMSRHPNLAHRFAPKIKPDEQANQEPDEDMSSEESEPVHFLSEQAIAQEYYKQSDLPFNLAPAGFTKADKPEDSEDTSPPRTPKNRLPGKITFNEEAQETSEFDLLFKVRDDSDDVIPLTKASGQDENGPRVMNYCVDDGEEKREMPYAEEEAETAPIRVGYIWGSGGCDICYNPMEWRDFVNGSSAFALKKNPENDSSLKDCYQNAFFDGEGAGPSTVGHFIKFEMPNLSPWIEEIEDSPETIDTIWPFNLLNQYFRGRITSNCLLSKLTLQHSTRCGGDVNYPEPLRKALDQQDDEYLRQNYPLLSQESDDGSEKQNQDKSSCTSFDALTNWFEAAGWPSNLLILFFRGMRNAYHDDPNRRMTELHGPSDDSSQLDPNVRIQQLINQGETSGQIERERHTDSSGKSKKQFPKTVTPERVHGGTSSPRSRRRPPWARQFLLWP